jgi:hypothetical protein
MITGRILRKGLEILQRNRGKRAVSADPLLALYGSGRALWADEHADEYVARMREGWD